MHVSIVFLALLVASRESARILALFAPKLMKRNGTEANGKDEDEDEFETIGIHSSKSKERPSDHLHAYQRLAACNFTRATGGAWENSEWYNWGRKDVRMTN